MASLAHVDYDMLEKEYVTGHMSIRSMAKKYDMSWSAVARIARERGWYAKRETFKAKKSEKTIEKMAENQAELASEIRGEMLTVVRAALYKFAEDLKRTDYMISASELVKVIKQGMLLIGEPTSRTEEKTLAVNASFDGLPPELLGELLSAAREVRNITRPAGQDLRPALESGKPN
jgi:hypothetical protein